MVPVAEIQICQENSLTTNNAFARGLRMPIAITPDKLSRYETLQQVGGKPLCGSCTFDAGADPDFYPSAI
jgi:hypothetical protein